VSIEGRMNVLLWYRLVGAYVGLLPLAHASEVSGCAWYGGDGPYLAVGPSPCRTMLCRSRLSVPSPVWLASRWQSCGVGSTLGQRGEMRLGRCKVRYEEVISEQARLV